MQRLDQRLETSSNQQATVVVFDQRRSRSSRSGEQQQQLMSICWFMRGDEAMTTVTSRSIGSASRSIGAVRSASRRRERQTSAAAALRVKTVVESSRTNDDWNRDEQRLLKIHDILSLILLTQIYTNINFFHNHELGTFILESK